MRIKLRLYLRDLDLLALKQHPAIRIQRLIRQALMDYVTNGECARIRVPPGAPTQIVAKNDSINITLNREKHEPVIQWLLGLRPGMRNSAIKTVFRSAIANPDLSAFALNSDLIVPEHARQALNGVPEQKSEPAAPQPSAEPTFSRSPFDAPAQPIPQSQQQSQFDDEEFDLFELDFGDAY